MKETHSDRSIRYNLIADAGSTTVDWALLSPDGKSAATFSTTGVNALLAGREGLRRAFAEAAALLPENAAIERVHYYGAGCATPEICRISEDELMNAFGAESASAASDLLGAARSLLGDNPGIACILGTGSNSCLYDGKTITGNIPPLGFILGDEGSGASLGKRLVADSLKGVLPPLVRDRMLAHHKLTVPDILQRVYREEAPNRFLASFVPFIAENIWNPYIYSLVLQEFTLFLQRNVLRYPGAFSMPVNFTGSIAWHFRDILTEAVSSHGLTPGRITQSPLQSLTEYHATHK